MLGDPARTPIRRDQERVSAQNQALQALVRRKEALVGRLQTMLAEVQAEQKAIEEERHRILKGPAATGTGVRD